MRDILKQFRKMQNSLLVKGVSSSPEFLKKAVSISERNSNAGSYEKSKSRSLRLFLSLNASQIILIPFSLMLHWPSLPFSTLIQGTNVQREALAWIYHAWKTNRERFDLFSIEDPKTSVPKSVILTWSLLFQSPEEFKAKKVDTLQTQKPTRSFPVNRQLRPKHDKGNRHWWRICIACGIELSNFIQKIESLTKKKGKVFWVWMRFWGLWPDWSGRLLGSQLPRNYSDSRTLSHVNWDEW